MTTLLVGSLNAAEVPPAFTKKPTAVKADDKIKIDFTVDRHTDVAVTVEDDQGKIVRHLAAGVLGKNPPEPLQPNSLAQSLTGTARTISARPRPAGRSGSASSSA